MSESNTPKIYKVIPAVMAEVGAITKDRKNAQQGYAFRGIDDAYKAFQPLFARLGMFAVPTVLETLREERETKSGGLLLYTSLKVKHTFYADDGSSIDCVTVGEAMDSGDKSSNKAMSAALKYALLEVFCVPTTEDNDTENHSPEPKPRNSPLERPTSGSANSARPANQNAPQGQAAPNAPQQANPDVITQDAVFEAWKSRKGVSPKSKKAYELFTLTFKDGDDRVFDVCCFDATHEQLNELKGKFLQVTHKPDWKNQGRELVNMKEVDNVQM